MESQLPRDDGPGADARCAESRGARSLAALARRRGADLLAGQLDPDGWVDAGAGRRWRQPGASSVSRARDKLGADPLHMLFDHVAGPVAADGAPGCSAAGCG